VFISEAEFDNKLFSEDERETLAAITEKLPNISSWDIVEWSHEEKAWREFEANRALIGY